MKDNLFSESHPALLFFYFTLVISTTMLFAHPVIIGISFLAAFSYRLCFEEKRSFFRYQILFMVPIWLLVVLFNAAFNHYGITPLYYLKTGAITLESIVYGMVLGALLWTSILWFANVNLIFTTDKFIYLFGRIFPSLGLFMSMVFRFVPRFRERWQQIREGQACLGKDIHEQKFFGKVHCIISEISILITWGLESGIAAVDSMHSKGYGVGKRTFYHIYSWHRADRRILTVGLFLYTGSIAGLNSGVGKSMYDPWIHLGGLPLNPKSFFAYLFWFFFCFYPVLISGTGAWIYRRQEKRMEKYLPFTKYSFIHKQQKS
ncbi:MAG: energy-coupling factor transporter transmembrane protein EcfT [Lachnospiraceae bacterium]|nr:energy-coupling factor transporter transmembrane protein EcfT [Lachnospiraceae bacterium]